MISYTLSDFHFLFLETERKRFFSSQSLMMPNRLGRHRNMLLSSMSTFVFCVVEPFAKAFSRLLELVSQREEILRIFDSFAIQHRVFWQKRVPSRDEHFACSTMSLIALDQSRGSEMHIVRILSCSKERSVKL